MESKKGNITLIILSTLLLVISLISGNASKWLEIYGTAFGLIQALLIMFGKKENWIFYNSYIIAFLILSVIFKLYGDVVENGIYILLGIIGTFNWYKVKQNKNNIFQIKYSNNKERFISIVIMLLITIGMYIYLVNTDDPLPLLDSITTAMGLTATYLMAKKKVESWIIWFVDDILMAIIYFLIPEQPIYLLILNIIWTLFAVGSLINWHKLALKSQNIV
jgi:nicotinamide mononucleotide transporter